MTLKNKFKLLLLFIIVICGSFIPEHFPEFFGDYVCKGGYKCGHPGGGMGNHLPTLHYGFRHWIFILMSLTFIGISISEIVLSEEKEK